VKRRRRLRRLAPDTELIRRRAAGETFRELALDYGVSHTTLSRYFARPEVGKQLKRAEQLQRAEQRAAEARFRAEQKAEREREHAARRTARQQPAPVSEDRPRRDGAANAGRSRSIPPLELEPFTDEWRAGYEAPRLFSPIDMLNDNDARRGIVPPRETRARERRRGSSGR
jgi:hypothetical protein